MVCTLVIIPVFSCLNINNSNIVKSISELKKEQQGKLSAIFDRYGIFFAFSTQQFNEQRKGGVTYARGTGGMLIPENNVDDYRAAICQHVKDCDAEFRKHVPLDNYIAYELANHEAWYTGSVSAAFSAVRGAYPECTLDDMWRVYKNKREEVTA